MKALKLTIIGIVLFLAGSLQAQVSISVNIGSPPPWGPSGHTEVRYYYIPDVEAYYDVQSSMFIYYGGGKWIHRKQLPGRYRNYDLYGGYKVVMSDYRGNTPYTHFREHKRQYARGYRGQEQRTIGERPGRGNSGEKRHSEGRSVKQDNKNNSRNAGHDRGNNRSNDHKNGNGKGKK